MKKLFFILLSFISVSVNASEPIRMGVITDIHYLSPNLMDNMYATQNYVYNTGKNIIVVPEVLDKVLDEYKKSDIDILLITGDLTKDGEKESHLDLQQKFKQLADKGIKVFVIPGNHDINMPNATKYQGNKTFKTANISPKEFESIYADYGYKHAVQRDANSLSYVAELDETTWLLAIDAARYEEYKERPITAGRLKSQTEEWILQVLKLAQTSNKQVVAMMHWGLVEHLPMQAMLFNDYLVADNNRIASLLADNGVKVVFTGHFHSNDISEFVTEKGNKINDVETGALVSYPFAYRYIDLYKDSIKISTENITTIYSQADLFEKNRDLMKKVARERSLPMLKSKGFDFSDKQMKVIADIAGDLFVIHLLGDEKVDNETKQKLVNIFEEMEFPIDDSFHNIEIDLLPKDNNITILF